MSALVSIILPVHNGVDTLGAALKSILAQDYRNLELLVLDDGSTDGSAELAGSFKDERLRVVGDCEKHGLARRLNEGIALSRGEYIARMDADDVAFPERLSRQVEFLDANPGVDLVGTRALVFDQCGRVLGLLPYAGDHATICARPWKGFPLAHPTWMARRGWFERYGYAIPECARAEDQELLVRAYDSSRYACLPGVFLAYRKPRETLRRKLATRYSLGCAQYGVQWRARRRGQALMAGAAAVGKMAWDLLDWVLGRGAVRPNVSAEPVPEAVQSQWAGFRDDLREAGLGLRQPEVLRVATVPMFFLHHLPRQTRRLCAAGYRLTLVTSPVAGFETLRGWPGLSVIGMDIPRPISPVRDARAFFRLCALLHRLRPDMVHSTTPKAGLLCMTASWLMGVPVRLHTFTGLVWSGQKGLPRRVGMLADRIMLRFATQCYADSASQREFMLDAGIRAARAIEVLGQGSLAGVDVEALHPGGKEALAVVGMQELGIPEGHRVVVFVGRVRGDKGVRELVEAFEYVHEKLGSVSLLVLGPDETDTDSVPQAVLERMHRHPDIHLLGYRASAVGVLAMADLLCQPSYREGFSSVVLEAAALGVPCVGTDVVGLRDPIVDGVTGLLVPVKDPLALGRALERLLREADTRLAMGHAARQRVERHFDSRHVDAMLVAEYERQLARGQ